MQDKSNDSKSSRPRQWSLWTTSGPKKNLKNSINTPQMTEIESTLAKPFKVTEMVTFKKINLFSSLNPSNLNLFLLNAINTLNKKLLPGLNPKSSVPFSKTKK